MGALGKSEEEMIFRKDKPSKLKKAKEENDKIVTLFIKGVNDSVQQRINLIEKELRHD